MVGELGLGLCFATAIAVLPACASAPPRAAIADECWGNAHCIDVCSRAETEQDSRYCKDLQIDAYRQANKAHEYDPKQRAREAEQAKAAKAEILIIGPSEEPMMPPRIAARTMPAIVAIQAGSSLGTGFGVTDLGWIATNLHVVAGASDIRILLMDGTERPVSGVIAFDARNDLAVLRAEGLKAALSLADSDNVVIGEAVVAIGHPLGLASTVSNGIVSSVREIHEGSTVLQITAPIAPGSSGGPLINARGQVIGVVAATVLGGQNLNFAIPSRYLRDQLLTSMKKPSAMSLEDFAAATRVYQKHRDPEPADNRRAVALRDGCTEADIALALRLPREAITAAAPWCNGEKAGACYQLYRGAALDLAGKLSGACKGIRGIIEGGAASASAVSDAAAQARAMRAVLEAVIRAAQGPGNGRSQD